MSPAALKGSSIACFVVCVILLFVAWERYHDNASKVEGMNQLIGSSPLGGMLNQMSGGRATMEPGMPDATKYALFFAALTGVGGIVCLFMSKKAATAKPSPSTPPPTA